MQEPIRVLEINSGSKVYGGVSSFLFNTYSAVDTTKVQFDFLSAGESTYGLVREKILSRGGRIYDLKVKTKGLNEKVQIYKQMKAFLAKHPYEIVHINSGNFYFNLCVARACKAMKIKHIIVHSHSIANIRDSKLKRMSIEILKPILASQADSYFACSYEAAKYMFPKSCLKDAKMIRNGVDVGRFGYDAAVRSEMRSEYGIQDQIVLAQVGRLVEEKNPIFGIRVLKSVIDHGVNAELYIVGDGVQRELLERTAEELNVSQHLHILKPRNDIEKVYQMADFLLMPSLYEGLGMVLVEAQAAGLTCLASTGVPREVNITGNVSFFGIGPGQEKEWAACIAEHLSYERTDRSDAIREAGYERTAAAENLTEIYEAIKAERI